MQAQHDCQQQLHGYDLLCKLVHPASCLCMVYVSGEREHDNWLMDQAQPQTGIDT